MVSVRRLRANVQSHAAPELARRLRTGRDTSIRVRLEKAELGSLPSDELAVSFTPTSGRSDQRLQSSGRFQN